MFEWLKNKFKKEEDEIKKEEDLVKSNEIEDEENKNLDEQEIEDEVKDSVSQDESVEDFSTETSEVKESETSEMDLEKNVDDNSIEEITTEEEIEEPKETQDTTKMEVEEEAQIEDSKYAEVEEETDEKVDVETVEERVKKEEAIEDKEAAEEKIEVSKEPSEDIKIEEDTEEKIEEPSDDKNNKLGFFGRLKEGLTKTRKEVGIKINTVLGNYVKIDDEMLEDLEDILISADVGMNTTMKLIDNLRETLIREKINEPSKVKPLLMEEAKKLMNPELNTGLITKSPTIILIVGVNGVGKTTTIGKLSQRFKNDGKSVVVCAADTFRAAAIDQLEEWGHRANVDVISHKEGSDPAAVVFDAIAAAKARKTDILIVDTAGRLHNKSNLMNELEKINRIIKKNYPEANRETLLVLDATTGQNAMNQAKTFKEASEITGIALTKLDGTAKGGVVIGLQSELEIPIKLVGVGEGIDDLQDFNLDNFIEAIFE